MRSYAGPFPPTTQPTYIVTLLLLDQSIGSRNEAQGTKGIGKKGRKKKKQAKKKTQTKVGLCVCVSLVISLLFFFNTCCLIFFSMKMNDLQSRGFAVRPRRVCSSCSRSRLSPSLRAPCWRQHAGQPRCRSRRMKEPCRERNACRATR